MQMHHGGHLLGRAGPEPRLEPDRAPGGTQPPAGVLTVDEIELTKVPVGDLHLQFVGDDGTSCYDADNSDSALNAGDLPTLQLHPLRELFPPAPDGPFAGLPQQFSALSKRLPALGIESIEALAAAEPEGLIHRSLRRSQRTGDDGAEIPHRRTMAAAIQAARANLGQSPVQGRVFERLRLRSGASFAPSSRSSNGP